MTRFRLSTLLILFNSGLALTAIAVVALAAAGLLRRLADEQALARVAQAGQSARNALERAGEGALTQAQLLSERPTLLRLMRAGESGALQSFLAQFQATSQLAGAAVWRAGGLFAAGGLEAGLWERLAAQRRAQASGTAFLPPTAGGQYLLTAWAAVPEEAETYALTAIALDADFAAELSTEVGLPVQLTTLAAAEPALTPAQGAALRRGEALTFEAAAPARYLALLPLPAGGLLQAELSAAETEASVWALTQSMIALALGVALAAALLSAGAGRWLSRPLGALTRAAERIGQGDFSAPVPHAPRGEIGLLAETLDDMRRRLGQLTQDLQAQQAESRAVLAGISEGVFAVDRERRVRFINPQAAGLLGLTPEAAVGRFCGDVLQPAGPARPCEEQCPIIHARFQAGARAIEHLRLPDGRRRTVVVTSAAPAPEAGGGFRQIQVLRDETDVEAARRARDAVLANISHEFRTPLSAQLASLELLLDQLPRLSPAQIRELVVSLQRGTLRLTQLIDNLLESVRVEAGQAALRRGPVALDSVVEQALELTRPLLDQRGQTVEVELPYPLPLVSGDAPRLVQVLVNLLANANKYAPAESTIRIGGAVAPGWLTVWVADEGPGLPAGAEGALFAPFVRSAGDEPAERGIGLGLFIVRSIVERHGGTVQAENLAPGARFTLRLPSAPEGAP
jgi:signal transduction histidine kinase/HAMP domain-containing protein